MFKQYSVRKVVFVFAGIVFAGLGIAINRLVNLGVDPWSTFNLGISTATGISFGTVMLATSLIILIPVFLLSRNLVNLGTLVNMVLLGYVSDFFVMILEPVMSTESLEAGNMVWRIFLMLVGIVVTCFGAALYMRPNLGAGPYDAVGWVIEKLTHKKFTYRWNRITTDVLCVAIGFALGATVGVVTFVMAFLTGPLISFFTNGIASWLVYGETKVPTEGKATDDAALAEA